MTSDDTDPFTSGHEEVRILAPDFALKKLIGEDVDIRQVLSPENIEKAQAVINAHKESFLEWVMKDMATLEEAYKAAHAHMSASESEIKKLERAALVIKSQAGTFGFTLATAVAKSLEEFCIRYFRPTPGHLQVVRKHIDTLSAIFRQNISGDGGKIGAELTQSLFELANKYKE